MLKKPPRYNPEMVAKILAARDAPKVEIPSDEEGFMRWLNGEPVATRRPSK